MDYFAIINEVNNRLAQIDFAKIWPGFKCLTFAFYDDEYAYFHNKKIKKPKQFIGNSAIFYNGEYIAIWYLKELPDYDIITSKIVHEMFHAYQLSNGEKRFPNEFEALINYRYNLLNLTIRAEENKILYELLDNYNAAKYEEFLRLRKYRHLNYATEYNYEAAIETVEGSAEYVELKALSCLNIEKYQTALGQLKATLTNAENLLQTRKVSYAIGAAIFLIVHKFIREDIYTIKDNREPISNLLIKKTSYVAVNKDINKAISRLYTAYITDYKELISDTITTKKIVLEGKYKLKAFNVYDPKYYEGYLYSTHFIMYENDKNEDVVLYGNFIAVVKDSYIVRLYQI
ncbi:MAG: hypothetical protein BWX74_00418 [Tenericutes bacterium ADurb.Bin087]|nr:MAG: hypothetical protein BWX74_00418 [Tenericutes bacterium ADurb.Bin087]